MFSTSPKKNYPKSFKYKNWLYYIKCVWQKLKNQLILQFSLFLLLFIGPTTLFGTIYGSSCTISVNFYLYLQYFQQKVFSFTSPKIFFIQKLTLLYKVCVWQKLNNQLILLFSLFLLLFMGFTILFGIIYRSYCTISTNFYLYL